MSVETLLTFTLASTLLALAPGPDNLFVLLQSALYGRKAGLLITLGLCSGLVFHTTLVAAGVAAIFLVNTLAFNLLKFVGAAYLIYLAIQAYRAKPVPVVTDSPPALAPWRLYRRGILMNITNPKVGIFFLAFLPQFASSENGSIAIQIMVLGLIFMLTALLVFSALAVLASKLAPWFTRSNKAQCTLNRMAAVVFTALALRLALTNH